MLFKDVAERAPDRVAAPLQHVSVDLRGAQIRVPELLLHGADIGTSFQQMRCE